MNEKRVYTFGNGKAEGNAQMREVLGGKGANLAECINSFFVHNCYRYMFYFFLRC